MVKKKRQNKIKANFFEALRYLRESKKHFYIISVIFIVGILIGIAFYSKLSFLDEILKELLRKIEGLGAFGIISFILRNNIKGAFLGLFLGVILGIFPVINIFSNGVILGYVVKKVVAEDGISQLWRILPHGVFELPAIIISLGLGVKLGMFIFSKNSGDEFLKRLKKSLFVFVFVVLPLLIVAAIIEGILIFVMK